MAQSIEEWLKRPDIKEIKGHSKGDRASRDFFRDPLRPITLRPNELLAPADGTVLYTLMNVNPDAPFEIKNVKGEKNFTLKELLADDDYEFPSLVVGIFMSELDVHINRVPANGYYVDLHKTNPIQTHGMSMIMVEHELLQEMHHHYKKEDLEYLRHNEKNVSAFYCPAIKGRFYVVQIADKDIDVIVNWGMNQHMMQGERFGNIRFGSQVDTVIPLTGDVDYEFLVKPLQHVEAGLDPIIRIHKE